MACNTVAMVCTSLLNFILIGKPRCFAGPKTRDLTEFGIFRGRIVFRPRFVISQNDTKSRQKPDSSQHLQGTRRYPAVCQCLVHRLTQPISDEQQRHNDNGIQRQQRQTIYSTCSYNQQPSVHPTVRQDMRKFD